MLAAFLVAIVIGASFSSIGAPLKGPFAVIAIGFIAVSLGLFVGVVAYSKVKGWFGGLGAAKKYIWLVVLILITAVIFPAPFSFNVQ